MDSTQEHENRTREIAYHLWDAAGRPQGRSEEFWQSASNITRGKPGLANAVARFLSPEIWTAIATTAAAVAAGASVWTALQQEAATYNTAVYNKQVEVLGVFTSNAMRLETYSAETRSNMFPDPEVNTPGLEQEAEKAYLLKARLLLEDMSAQLGQINLIAPSATDCATRIYNGAAGLIGYHTTIRQTIKSMVEMSPPDKKAEIERQWSRAFFPMHEGLGRGVTSFMSSAAAALTRGKPLALQSVTCSWEQKP